MRAPTVAVVDGILVILYWNDHGPPHFHADGPGFRARLRIEDRSILDQQGKMPASAQRRLRERALGHRDALTENWHRAREQLPLRGIS